MLPARLCCLDSVFLPGVAGTLVYDLCSPSGAASRLVCSSESFSMTSRGGRWERRFGTDGLRMARRKVKGEEGAVVGVEILLALSSSAAGPK
jgi:hypothetical protein